jgi:hypothetical protein
MQRVCCSPGPVSTCLAGDQVVLLATSLGPSLRVQVFALKMELLVSFASGFDGLALVSVRQRKHVLERNRSAVPRDQSLRRGTHRERPSFVLHGREYVVAMLVLICNQRILTCSARVLAMRSIQGLLDIKNMHHP